MNNLLFLSVMMNVIFMLSVFTGQMDWLRSMHHDADFERASLERPMVSWHRQPSSHPLFAWPNAQQANDEIRWTKRNGSSS